MGVFQRVVVFVLVLESQIIEVYLVQGGFVSAVDERERNSKGN